jgi:hypothetical protein
MHTTVTVGMTSTAGQTCTSARPSSLSAWTVPSGTSPATHVCTCLSLPGSLRTHLHHEVVVVGSDRGTNLGIRPVLHGLIYKRVGGESARRPHAHHDRVRLHPHVGVVGGGNRGVVGSSLLFVGIRFLVLIRSDSSSPRLTRSHLARSLGQSVRMFFVLVPDSQTKTCPQAVSREYHRTRNKNKQTNKLTSLYVGVRITAEWRGAARTSGLGVVLGLPPRPSQTST